MQEDQLSREQLIQQLATQRRRVSSLERSIASSQLLERQLSQSEKRFRSIAESANDAIVSADGDGKIMYWNKGSQTIFGYEENEVMGQPLAMLMPDRYKNLHEEGLARYKATGNAAVIGTTIELSGVRKDGHEFPLELSLASWITEDGVFFSGIIRDVSERKRVEGARRASEEMYRALFEQAADGIFVTARDGQVVAANNAALEMFGFSGAEAIGSDVSQRFANSADRQRFRDAIGKGAITSFEVTLRRQNGTEIDVLLTATRLLDDDGNSIGVQGIVHDMTSRMQAQIKGSVPLESVPHGAVSSSEEHVEELDRGLGSEAAAHSSESTQIRNGPTENVSADDYLFGDVQLVIEPPVQATTVLKLHQWLQQTGNAELGKFSGTLGGETVLSVAVSKPFPVTWFTESSLVTAVSEEAFTGDRETYAGEGQLAAAAASLGGELLTGAKNTTPRRIRLTLA